MADTQRQAQVIFQPLISGSWQDDPRLTDYRAEWLSQLLVERVTWGPNAASQKLGEYTIAAPGYIWFRFWLPEPDQVVEKYFDAEGDAVGMYVPVCYPLEREGDVYRTVTLVLALWVTMDRRVAVLRERDFEEATERRILGAAEIERAESRIRELTTAIHQEEFPPALVRNFEINMNRPPGI